MVWYTRLVSKLAAAAATSSSSSTLFKNLTTQKHPALSKLGATSTVFKKFTTQNHPTLSKQKHSFSNHLGVYKSPPVLIISSKYLNNVLMVKRYSTYATRDPPEWLRKILETIIRVTNHPDYLPTLLLFYFMSNIILLDNYYAENCETMLYTNRTQGLLTPPSADKVLAKRIFNMDKLGLLPEEHPDCVRVKSIGDQIVKALESDIEAMKNKVKNLGVDHLVGLEWEFVVTSDTKFTSASVPGGKICVSSDLLKHLQSDADIATIIGHEVGHIVARHNSFRLNHKMKAIDLANKYFGLSISSPKMAEHTPKGILGRLWFIYLGGQRVEMEADYIGLLLMASAGFDPQEAPKVYAMLDQHPSSSSSSGKKRAEYLAEAKVMKEAKSIYSKTIESRKMNDIKDI